MKTKTSPAATAAAQWWAEQVGAPAFRNTDSSDSPEDQRNMGLAGAMASMIADRHPVSATAGEKFVAALVPRIQRHLDNGVHATLGVDYGPDMELAEAASEAGVNSSRFPWKTIMWVEADHVYVSAGYRGRHTLVWASEEWLANRPICGAQKWDDVKGEKLGWRNYHGEPWQCGLPKYHEQACEHTAALALCATCGAPDGWAHDPERSGRTADFHEFVAS
jgi:hypothetical protein